MIGISLFSGAGGFELGFERAGIRTVLQAESDPWCLSVLERHWPDGERVTDVRSVGSYQFRRCDPALGSHRRQSHRTDGQRNNGHAQPCIDLIYGGFPCQDVSVAGKRAGLSGERSGLWSEFRRVLRELRPRWVVVENVPGLLSSNSGRDFEVILGGLDELGYGVAWRVLDARYFGVPQRRRRVFLVGCLGDPIRAGQVLAVCAGCGGDSPKGSKAGEELAPTLDDGARRASVDLPMIAAGLTSGSHPGSNMPGRVRSHQRPGSNDTGGLAGVRRLTPLECERLMGWPDEHTRYTADGREIPDSHRYRLCGNGVVAPVAEYIGHRLVAVDQLLRAEQPATRTASG